MKNVQIQVSQLMKNGIIKENPIFVQLLALCPLLAVTTSAINAVVMGLCTTVVMMCASGAISFLKRTISPQVRIATFIVIVASFVTVVQLLMAAFAPPDINNMLGIFIPLIAVNCIVFARIEIFASKNPVFFSGVDALAMGLGVTLGLFVLGAIREIFGAGSIFGIELIADSSMHMLIMIMAPGAFFTLGTIIMIMKYRASKRRANA
ncbi:MAG: electron transport complex subunit RsxE [Clostridiales bacterium]|nr:electron transport complex subunit RsxE [Clostridiales bacterium]